MKFLISIKGKIQTQHKSLKKLIFGSFFKGLIIYFMTPLYSAGAINRQEIVMYEASLKRKNHLLPNDITSAAVQTLSDFFINPTDSIIHKLVLK